jgi:hypothetical protein
MAESGPVLLAGLALHLRAFEELSPSRPVGLGGPGPIPFEAIDRYAARFGIDEETFDDLLRFVRALDDEYLDWAAESASANPHPRRT